MTLPLQALIFDSHYDPYRGVVSSVRVVNGTLKTGSRLRFLQAGAVHDADEGVRTPDNVPVGSLGLGETGYLIAGIKDVAEARSGETVTEIARPRPSRGRRLPGPEAHGVLRPVPDRRRPVQRPARVAGEVRLNDASFTYEPRPGALGFGFRCISRFAAHGDRAERLEREFDLSLIATALGRLPGAHGDRGRRGDRQPVGHAARGLDRLHRGAVPHLHDPHAHHLHGTRLGGAVPSRWAR